MTTGTNKNNKTNVQNPLIDTSSVTVNAFNAIKNKEKADTNFILGQDDKTTWKSPNFKVKVKAWTQVDIFFFPFNRCKCRGFYGNS